jgi:osmoprotectant transport system permease protein
MLTDAWHYLLDGSNWQGSQGITQLLLQQLLLTVTALAVATGLGLPVALWLGHLGRGGALAINISNVGRAVPTFAVLVLLSVGPAGTTVLGPFGRAGLATLIALVLFALPPVITNAYVAVREVDADVVESARGMGMTGLQVFRRVELPLAAPLVVAGLRLALVQVWATATIAALVAGPGLGRIITDGFYHSNYGEGFAGAIVVAVGALLLELLAAGVQRAVDPVREGGPGGPRRTTVGLPVDGQEVEGVPAD